MTGFDALSQREREVLGLIKIGATYKTIGKRLNIKLSTVANLITRAYKKLGVFRKEQCIALLLEREPRTCKPVEIDDLKRWRDIAAEAERAGIRGSSALVSDIDDLLRKAA